MQALFLNVVNMSLTASIIALAVLVLRLFLRRAPRWFSYALWTVVLFRLICPVSFTAEHSLLGTLGVSAGSNGHVQVASDILPAAATDALEILSPPATPLPADIGIPLHQWPYYASCIWIAGMAAMMLYALFSWVRLRQRLAEAIRTEEGVWESDLIDTPFVLGLIHPRIYLPSGLTETERRLVLLHERGHIYRRDYIVKLIAFLILSVHWFNPIIWLTFQQMCVDMEICCDERVLRGLSREETANYSATLLHLQTRRPIISGAVLAFGENGTKGRIRHALRYRRPLGWTIAAAVVLCIASAVFLLANPRLEPTASRNLYSLKNEYIGDHIADGEILGALGIFDRVGPYTMELDTQQRPFGITICFSEPLPENADQTAITNYMNQCGILFLALVDNADYFKWQFDKSAEVGYVSVDSGDNQIIKEYGSSLEQFEKLLKKMDFQAEDYIG